MPDLTKLQFYSGNNYLKRSDSVGQMNAVVNNTSSVNATSITHGLGYIPQFIVAIDYQNNGIWWANEYCSAWRNPGGANDGSIVVHPMIDTNKLYLISAADTGGTMAPATRPVKYVVYLDS